MPTEEVDPVAKSLSLDLDIVVDTQIKRTESKDKVARAVSSLFRDHGELRVEDNEVQFVSHDLESLRFLKDQFRDRQVRAAARRLLLTNKGDSESNNTFLLLNKQAATVSIAALCDDPQESPLGPIVLRIKSPQVDRVIDWITAGFYT